MLDRCSRLLSLALVFIFLATAALADPVTGAPDAAGYHITGRGQGPHISRWLGIELNVKAWPFSAVCDGVTDDTRAFNAAMSFIGVKVFVPPTLKGCALNGAAPPTNSYIEGTSSPIYDFNPTTPWSHVVATPTATMVWNYNNAGNITVKSLDTLGSTSLNNLSNVICINAGNTAQDEFLFSSYRFCGNGGFGDIGDYPNTVISIDTNWIQNGNLIGVGSASGGLVNLIDSEVDGGSFTENSFGLFFGNGANNNVISPMTRIEFNTYGVYCFQCAKEDFGGQYDRNTNAAIGFNGAGYSTGNSGGGSGTDGYGIDWGIKVHGIFTRNGNAGTSGNQAHFEFYGGNTNVTFSDISTSHDCGDNGCASDGPNSPKYIAEFADSTDVNIAFLAGGYTGFTTAPFNFITGTGPANLTVIGAVGIAQSQYQGEHNFTGDIAVSQLATPGAGTIANGGATGAATWTYTVVALSGATAHSAAGTTFSIANGPATLTTTNFLQLTLPHVQGATSLAIYRTAHGTTPGTNGLIATVPAQTRIFEDTGLAGDTTTAPITNTTGNMTVAGNFTVTGTCTGCGGGGGSGTVASSTTGQLPVYTAATTVTGSANATLTTGALTLGVSGTAGSIKMGNATSGTVTIQPVTGALGTVTLSLPAATDTLIGKATTDTLTNKTYDTAGSGNSFKINGVSITGVNGTGNVCLTTNCSLVTPTLGVATVTTINGVTIPSVTDTAALLGTNQSYTKGQAVTPTAAGTQSAAGTLTPDFSASNSTTFTFGAGNLTIANPTNVKAGQTYQFKATQDGTGSRTIAWGTNYKWAGGSAPTLSTAAGKSDIISCWADTTTTINCTLVGLAFQ